jgi:2-polyprenyl-3-methyl-5-hydroxy-6-metoxy-1,4-benzoquinol methylase
MFETQERGTFNRLCQTSPGDAPYIMGHTDRERRRLLIQGAVINPLTDTFLRRAGISAGMHVLELGCGVAEVSLIAARLVGPYGSLHGLDVDPAALEIARRRAQSAGHSHLTFELVNVQQFRPRRSYDAVIGRHILIHTPDVIEVLRRAVSMVHTGGIIAFQEFDVSSPIRGYPEMPLMFKMQDLISEFCRRALPRAGIGMQLPKLMQDAGLPPPVCRAEFSTDGGPHSPLYKWVAETVRSLLPHMEELRLTTAEAVDIDSLEDRLRQEALETRGFAAVGLMIGAFARKT